MRSFGSRGYLASAYAVMVLAGGSAQVAIATDEASDTEAIQEVVVTANKREQSINTVPLTITVATGDQLIQRGITSTADLAQIVPGLTAEPSPFNTPVYTLRGVGFYDSTLSASPTVAVYTDEVPLPFSAMTKAAALDLERVEVLKGPQGTLFGENTTGGAINYIAAKPTNHFEAGINDSYGRFNDNDVQGFISGPLADTLSGRAAVRVHESGNWQDSYTRADSLGATRTYQGRVLLDWAPSEQFKAALNLNGWVDDSDSQAPQHIANQIAVPSSPNTPAILAYPLAPAGAQAADWSTNIGPLRHNDYFGQGALRLDYDLNSAVKLTSITAYERYKTDSRDDFDGMALNVSDNVTRGHINTFSQELRASGSVDHLVWVAGGNFEDDRTYDKLYYYFGDQTGSTVGGFHMTLVSNFTEQNIDSKAAFANVEYEIVPRLTVLGGVRYTRTNRSFVGCSSDENDGSATKAFEFLEGLLRNPALPFVTIPPYGCFTLDAAYAPIVNPLQNHLDESNVSWRSGLNFKTDNNGLLYATVSKGFKAGSFPTTSASSVAQYQPVRQESVLATEAGFKQPLLGRRVQWDAAAFYYDYRNKQLQGRVDDIVFGPLDALVQVPKSRVWGVETQIDTHLLPGLAFSLGATYLNTRIDDFIGYNNAGVFQNYRGSKFPYAPEVQVVADTQYDVPITGQLLGYVGTNVTYNSSTPASIGNISYLQLRSYANLGVRLGVKSSEDTWHAELWGRNVLNTYYWTNAVQTEDGYVRYAARPATYGISVSYRWK